MEREGIGFLLIADLDLGHPDSKLTWPEYRDELERDLRREHAQTGPWDFVLIAGGLRAGGRSRRRTTGYDTEVSERSVGELLDFIRTLGSSPNVVAVRGAGEFPTPLQGVPASASHGCVVHEIGTARAVVVWLDTHEDVEAQVHAIDGLHPGWRDAEIRILLTRDAADGERLAAVSRSFDLHCSALSRRVAETSSRHVEARSLLGRGTGAPPHYGYASGRITPESASVRYRVLLEEGRPHFAEDMWLARQRAMSVPAEAGETGKFLVISVGGRLERLPSPHPRVTSASASVDGRLAGPPRWNAATKRFTVSLTLGAERLQYEVETMPGGFVRRTPPDDVPAASLRCDTSSGVVEVSDGMVVHRRPGAPDVVVLTQVWPVSLAAIPGTQHIIVAAEGDLIVVSEQGDLVRTIAAHDDPCAGVAVSGDGRLTASISVRGELKLWRTHDWAELARWNSTKQSSPLDPIRFTPTEHTLVVCRSGAVELHVIDATILEASAAAPPTSVTAKVVLVGQGRVGKTCLAERLVGDTYSDQPPTHGMRFWSMPMPADGEAEREVVLWDLGGQSEYRLLHQIFLPDTELALVLVDPATEAYADVREWIERLDNAGPTPKILVATKVDSDESPVDHAALARLQAECGLKATVLTSAKSGRGRGELMLAIDRNIAWGSLAKQMRGRAGQWLHERCDSLRRSGKAVVTFAELEPELPADIDGADLIGAIRQLARRGAIANTRTATGEQVIVLAIQEIERYAGSLIVAAQQRASGVPALDASTLLSARMQFPRIPDEQRLARRDECVVLDCVVEMLVQQGLALLHHGQLVFPTLFATGGDEARPPAATVAFEFGGAVDNAYASLVTDLALTNAYGVPRMSRLTARFSRAGLGTCGIRRNEAAPGKRRGLEVFFEGEAAEATEHAFVCFVEEHLRRLGLELVEHSRLACSACAQPFDSAVVDKRLAASKVDVICQLCEARTRIVLRSDQARRRDASVAQQTQQQRGHAREGRGRSAASGKRLIESGADGGTPHWLLLLSDLHVGADSDIDTMRQTLLEDLMRADGPKPERFAGLVVSGDLTNRATQVEFERAHALIGSLVDDLPGITAANTVIVPGNHDVDWSHPGVYQFHQGKRPDGLTDHEFIEHGPVKLVRNEEAYRASFGNFSKGIYETFYQRAYPRDPAQQVDVFDVPHAGLTFVTFNSAWNTAQYSPHDAQIVDAAVGNALERLAEVPSSRLKIAVWHHPISGNEKIRREAFVQRLRAADVRLCIHGHVHESRADLLGYLHPKRINVIGVGSFGAPAHERVESTPRLYHLLQFAEDRSSVRVHTRQLARSGGAWEPFYEWPHPSDSEQRLPYFDIEI